MMNMIEASSPLAAMQPPSFLGGCGFAANAPPSYVSLAAAKSFGHNSFNFKDLSMQRSMRKSQSDYFNMKPVRGSSPTASLAADLSQNFHIDQSPQLPTPRRALFSTNLFASQNYGASLTTPPIPSSSPGLDSMDIEVSPLPHKAPYCAIELQLQSPTPEGTPNEISSLILPSPQFSESPVESMVLSMPPERRKSVPARPSLSKFKGSSTSSLPSRATISEPQPPPFKFGNFAFKPATSSSLSLSEIFEQSPVQERPTSRQSNLVSGLPRARQVLSNLTNTARNASPMAQHIRKSSNPLTRPRKQFRRSLSMFEHPDDVMKREKEENPAPILPSIADIEVPHMLQLPHFVSDDQTGGLPRISKETMIDILDGKFNQLYEKLVVVDCRFEYEYLGGHIDGAVNFNDKEKLATQLFEVEPTSKALLIFHCEYSAHRAPLMAKFIRNKDRSINAERYPALTYPEAYILDGGYSSFFKDHSSRCFPQNYVEMDAKEFAFDCERGLGKVKQRSKLVRAQTFAFGQHSPSLDSSPTAMCRSRNDDDMDLDLGLEYTPVAGGRTAIESLRARNQRMFSY